MKKHFLILLLIFGLAITQITLIAQDSWQQLTPTGNIPEARYGHSMVAIGNKVYLFGGKNNRKKSSFDMIHLYSTDIWEWSEEEPNNAPPPARFNHQAIERNGKIYVFFGMGNNGVLDDIWEYDPDTKLWTQIIPDGALLPEARSEHTATIYGNIVYIVGGKDANGNPLSDIWAYRFTNNTWQNCTGIPGTSIFGHTAAFYNGELLLYGGLRNGGVLAPDILKYSPGSDSWSSVTPVGDYYPTANAASVTYQSQVFLFGGYSGTYEPLSFIWELSTNNFTQLANGPALAGAAAALASSAAQTKNKDTEYVKFMIFGGLNDSTVFENTWNNTSDIEIPASISEIHNANILVYPNPATEQIYIDISHETFGNTYCTYSLYDILGKKISQGIVETQKQQLDISVIPQGLYFLHIFTENNLIAVQKIVKK